MAISSVMRGVVPTGTAGCRVKGLFSGVAVAARRVGADLAVRTDALPKDGRLSDVVGEPDVVVRHYAHQAGWTNDRIVRIGTWGYGERPLYRRMAELAERVRGEWPRSIALIGLENNHQYVADLIREKMFGKDVL